MHERAQGLGGGCRRRLGPMGTAAACARNGTLGHTWGLVEVFVDLCVSGKKRSGEAR